MIRDILYKSDILDGLFTQKDFEFLKDTNSKQENIENEIKIADEKKNKIIKKIKNVDVEGEEIKKIKPEHLKEYVDKAEIAFESINAIIRNLNNILDEFNEIEKEILELVIKQDSNITIDLKESVKKIDVKIEEFKKKQKRINEKNKKYTLLVDKFLNETEIKKIEKQEDNEQKLQKQKKKVHNRFDTSLSDNLELRISERHKRVYLPYTKAEVEEFLEKYPEEYISAKDVIEQEFIADISIYNKHPVLARFREAYSLSRNKEMKSAIDSLKFAMDIMFRRDINPAIIAAVKSQKQLDKYIECLDNGKLENFKYFNIIFEVNPI